MKALLCAIVLGTTFGYGICEMCGFYYNCKYGCCNYGSECCSRYISFNYNVYVGVGVTVAIVTTIGAIAVIIYLLKRKNRPGRVITAHQPGPSVVAHSSVTTTNNMGQVQSSSSVYPPPVGAPGYDPTLSPPVYYPPGAAAPPPGYSSYPPPYQSKS
ncbi:uncharacterized protein [Haliotis cracherodii]|uniref:uncharacterized protein n=1 Tax=Haliotis cracherodii TaxID=6455 RepID=UPI0039E9BFDA